MLLDIRVENIKCGGCANTIRTRLEEVFSVPVTVDIENGHVTVETTEDQRADVVARLAQLGYPETGTTEGLGKATAKAKSFVSCAIGRLNNTEDD